MFGLDDDHDGRAAAPVDIDGDGDLDLALLTLRGLKLFENTSEPQHYSRVRLADAGSGSVGAVVALTAGGVTRRDFVTLTQGFRTQGPLDLHFGLGETTAIETLEVRWPSGTVDVWHDLPVDRLLTVTEGTATVDARELSRWPDGTRPNLPEPPSLTVELSTLDGARTLLASANNRPAVVNFWAPWCAPCNIELPQLVSLAERYGDEVDFVGVSVELDDLESVRESIATFEIPYAQYLTNDAVMERFFGTSEAAALPSTFVFDGAGQLRRLFRGAITEADLESLLLSLRDEGVTEADLGLLARIAMGRGDYEAAAGHYMALADLQPDSVALLGVAWEHRRAVARFNAGVAHLSAGRTSDALATLQSAYELLGDDPAVLLQLGIAAAEAGDLTLAGRSLEQAVQADPELADGWFHKARVHRMRGESGAARNSYSRALQLDPGNRAARQGLAALGTAGASDR